MKLEEIRSKRKRNEEAQDELLLNRKKFEYQQDEIQQSYIQDRQNKEAVLEYFYGESEQYLFEEGLEENRRNEQRFLESSGEIMHHFSKRKTILEEENESLYEQELNELRKEDAHGKNESGGSSHTDSTN